LQEGDKKTKFQANKNKSEKTKEGKDKVKVKIPYFKDFNIKFTKRENIDKKILRTFRKFLKEKLKKNGVNWYALGLNTAQKEFWINFIGENLMPPMKYKDVTECIEFKSFSTNYIVWLLSHKGSVELYSYFINEKHEDVAGTFISKYNLKSSEEVQQLNSYIKSFAYIFNSAKENYDDKEESKVENEEEHRDFTHFVESNAHFENKTQNPKTKEPQICNKINNDIFSQDIYESNNKFEWNVKFDDYNKMFNNSFDYDKDYMFNEE